MSKVKRILSVIMAMVMVLAMSVPTFAGTVTPSKITVNNLDAKATITWLQIIEPSQSTATGWTFTNGALAEFQKVTAFSGLDEQQILWKLIKYADKDNKVTVPADTTAATAADFQAAMVNVEKNLGNSYTANDVKGNEITANKAGVYAIKATTTYTANYAYSPMAAFVSFKPYTTAPTALDNATVNAKRTTIKIEKTSSETDGVVEINKEVEYTVTTNVPYISDNVADKDVKYTITDKITGAEYSAKNGTLDVTVILGDGEAAKTETRQVTVKTETEPAGQSFVLDLSDIAKNRNNANLSLVIKYKAIVKSEKVENTVVPNDGNHTFTPKTNTLYTAKITMTKTGDASAKLEGAGFVVYRVDGEKTYYALVVKDTSKSNNEYVVTGWTENFETAKAENNLVMTDSEGKVVVRGLDDSYTYKFKEVKAPEGYSVNTDDSTATWDASTDEKPQTPDKRTGTASMNDTKLSALPSTGGIGTTIFTIGGCAIMIVAAGLFFATRRKTQK
jgi:LPXTG-motif cell wall-anchored protein